MNASVCQYVGDCSEKLPFTGLDLVSVLVVAMVLIALAVGIRTIFLAHRKKDE